MTKGPASGTIKAMGKRISLALAFLAVALFGLGCSRGADDRFHAGLQVRDAAVFDPGAGSRTRAAPARGAFAFEAEEAFPVGASLDDMEPAAAFADDELPRRRLVRRAEMRVRVESLERADYEIGALLERHGAFSSFSGATETSRRHTIRVPSDLHDPFVASLSGLGRVLQRTESAEDVTLRYFDLEGRLATQRELLETFRSYLGRAANIDEILSVEARIAELQRAIDGTGRDLRGLGDLVDYSTVTLSVEGPAAPGAFVGPTLSDRVGGLFDGFGGFLSGALVFAIGLAIYGIPVLLTLAFLYWLLLGRIGLLKKLFRLASGKPVGGKG